AYGLDAFRYFLLREMHFGADAGFSEEGLTGRINADLANDLGNLFSRVLSMTAKYFGSLVPQPAAFEDDDTAIADLCATAMRNYAQLFGHVQFAQGLESLWELIRALNKYVDSQAPWSLYKQGNMERLATVIHVLLTAMRKVAICLWPVMPETANRMLTQLGQTVADNLPPVPALEAEMEDFSGLVPGITVAPVSNLFPRIEKKDEAGASTKARKEKVRKEQRDAGTTAQPPAQAEMPAPVQSRAEVDFEHFKALDLRVGTVVVAEKHPNADRILRLEIDFGEGSLRQILSGLAEHFAPEELVGKQVCAVLNLPPRKIRGLMSHGMVLTAQSGDTLRLLTVLAPLDNGGEIA
ncbi:MAG: class I tRNA ligase family protein, partial [Desulfovibrionaceae bacterium]|nr:class I tRNA ligase family protein [Desulfovibrionaceae bacterium]